MIASQNRRAQRLKRLPKPMYPAMLLASVIVICM